MREKKAMTIRISKTLDHNMKMEGGFLPALAGFIPFLTGTVLPDLGVEALSGLASTGCSGFQIIILQAKVLGVRP